MSHKINQQMPTCYLEKTKTCVVNHWIRLSRGCSGVSGFGSLDLLKTKMLHYCSVTIFILLMVPPLLAEPASQIVWTPMILNVVKTGSPEKGESLATGCAGCHGRDGVSGNPEMPSLAGQLATYTYKQLMDYKQGDRSNMMMSPIAKNLKPQDIINLAAWYASLPAARPQSQEINKQSWGRAEKLVFKGDGKRTLPPCFVCHGAEGQGEKMDIPALAGQQSQYLRKTLMDYKQGIRHNDIYSRMRLIARQLNEKEIEALSRYYNQFQ